MTSITEQGTKPKKYDALIRAIKQGITHNKHNIKRAIPFTKNSQKLREELNLLTSYSSDTVYRLRYDSMTYDYISPAVTKLLGYTPSEMTKINFRSLIIETKIISNGVRSIQSFNELEASRKNGDVNKWQADYLVKTKDNRQIWLTDVSYPWFNKQGKIIGSIGSLRDITDRINAEKQTKEELVRLAHTDSLTGVSNRRTFFKVLDRELKRTSRTEIPFSILLIDIDYFKKINDTHGHATGDQILTGLSQVMSKCIRDTDLIARIGGEEFGVLLPDTDEEGAYWVAERICKQVSEHNFFAPNSVAPINCTVSIGISSTDENLEMNTTELYKQADLRLYIAKNTGRNQVSIDEIVQLH